MRIVARALLLATVLVSGWQGEAYAVGKRYALVVGINTYDNLGKDQQLQRAVNDVRALSEALKPLGFEVIKVEDATRSAFNRAWQEFMNKLGADDTAAIFFSGHGVEVGGLNYLLPRDVPAIRSGEEGLLKRESLSLVELVSDLRDRNPQMSLIVVDACRDNPFKRSGSRSIGGEKGLARMEPPEGAFMMFSAGAGETALDRLSDNDPVPTSVYMRHLLPLLSKSGLSLPEIAQQVRRDVRETASRVKHKQSPAYYDEVIGRFCLAGCEAQIAKGPKVDEEGQPAAPPQPTTEVALASAARAVTSDPLDAEAHYKRANALRDKKDYDGAIADYTAALKIDFGHVRALAARGRVYSLKKDYDRAVLDLTEAIQLDSKDARLFNSRGVAYSERRDFDRALSDFTDTIRLDPKFPYGYHNRGRILGLRMKRYDAGIADLSEAIRLDPKYVSAYHNRGGQYIEKGEYDKALADFDTALRLDPKYKYAHGGRGDVLMRRGEVDKAIAEYEAGIKLDPAYVYGLNGRGNAYVQKKDYERALADFNEAIRADPNGSDALVYRARLYVRKGEFDKSESDFAAALKLQPRSTFVLFNRADFWRRKGDFDRAIADYNACLLLEPASASILRARALVYADKGDKEKALADISESIRLLPTSATYYNERAWIQYKMGKPADGLADANKAIQMSPKYAAAFDTRAHIHEAMGKRDQAIADYRRALELLPGIEESLEGLRRLSADK